MYVKDVLKSWLRPCKPVSRALDACFQLPEQYLARIPDCVQMADENKLKKMLDSFYLNLKHEGNDFVTVLNIVLLVKGTVSVIISGPPLCKDGNANCPINSGNLEILIR